ncbi:MAG TPA: DUF2293 domain-containing protein [Chthoniobacterales bacterium]
MDTEGAVPAKSKPGEILVFLIRRDTVCAECGKELLRGSMVTLEKERGALCLECADLEALDFLPSGDAALTRRATKHSRLKALVLQFSRTRKRYERQGVLVQREALERAEAECLEDAEQRERRRIRAAEVEDETDKQYLASFAGRILELFPRCPPAEAQAMATHAGRKHSGRVGRTAAAKKLDAQAIQLAVVAAIRHRFTNYEELLMAGVDRHEARAWVQPAVQRQLAQWRPEPPGQASARTRTVE